MQLSILFHFFLVFLKNGSYKWSACWKISDQFDLNCSTLNSLTLHELMLMFTRWTGQHLQSWRYLPLEFRSCSGAAASHVTTAQRRRSQTNVDSLQQGTLLCWAESTVLPTDHRGCLLSCCLCWEKFCNKLWRSMTLPFRIKRQCLKLLMMLLRNGETAAEMYLHKIFYILP